MLDIRLDDFYEDRVKELQARYREPSGTAVIRILIRGASQEANLWPTSAEREGEGDEDDALMPGYQMAGAAA